MTEAVKMDNEQVELDQAKFVDYCDKAKIMTEQKKKENKHDEKRDFEGEAREKRPFSAPFQVYGTTDWPAKIKKQRTETEIVGGQSEKDSLEVPKKKSGKIKRRGKKKGKRKKPDKEEDAEKNAPINSMEC